MNINTKEHIQEKLDEKQSVFDSDTNLQQWLNRFEEEERTLLLSIDNQKITNSIQKLLEITRAIKDSEKEISYLLGFYDGVQLKKMLDCPM